MTDLKKKKEKKWKEGEEEEVGKREDILPWQLMQI